MTFVTILVAIIILSVVMLSHELGHFIACKICKVKVEEFGLGFPPRAVKLFKKGETLYSLNWIPFGGFNKILGEDEASKDSRSYNNQSVLKRIFIASGGIIFNLLLAWLIFTIWIWVISGTKVANFVAIVEVEKNSAAEIAGIKSNDIILDVNKNEMKSIIDLQAFNLEHKGQEVTYTLMHQNNRIEKKVTLGSGDAPLGVSLAETGGEVPKVVWYKAPWEALKEMWIITEVTFIYLWKTIISLFGFGQKMSFEMVGPIGMVGVISQTSFLGYSFLLRLAGLISLGLGIFNILPIPAVDGGKLFFLNLELIFRRKIFKDEHENTIHGIGFLVLIGLSILIAYLDIMRLR